jgi:ubiquinone/menaquinone biosynthesis C-methylase UbiE
MQRFKPVEMHGVDPSEGQLSYARTRPGTIGAIYRQGDAQQLPYADASFDLVTMALAICYVPDPAKGVAEMTRVVRRGGLVATYMWDHEVGGTPVEPLFRALARLGMSVGPPHPEASRIEEMRRLWAAAGLENIQTRVIEIETAYSDFNDFWDSNAAPGSPTASQMATLPREQVDRLKISLRESLRADVQGRIVLHARATAIKGNRPL